MLLPPVLLRVSSRFGPALLAVAAAVLLRWPVSVYLDGLPRDPNTALHMVIAAEVARTGDLLHLGGLDFPAAVPIRVVAVPVVLLAALVGQFLAPVSAFNLAATAWVAAQGLAVDRLGAAWGWSPAGRGVGAVAGVASPFALLALGNGQIENVAILPLCLVAWGGAGRLGATAGGLLLAAFCSPYQAVVAGLLALAQGAREGRAALGRVVLVALLAAAPVVAYYGSQAAPDDLGEDPAVAMALVRTRPAPPVGVIGARLDGLVLPRVHQNTQRGVVRTPMERLDAARFSPGWQAPGGLWPIEETTVAGWLGGLALLGGLAGAWRRRRDRRLQGVAIAAGLCLVLALGDRLRLTEQLVLPVPLPWAVADAVGGPLAAMEATWRFLAGVGFLLVLGLGGVVRRWRVALPLSVALLAETLLLAPGAWPVPASAPRVGELQAALPPGPVAVWPGLPVVSTLRHGLVSLALDRPVTTYNGSPQAQVVQEGYRPTVPATDLAGRDVETWLAESRAAGVVAVVELTDIPPGLGLPVDLPVSAVVEGFRVYRLDGG